MFTGLVEGRGTIREIRSDGAAVRLLVEAPAEMAGRTDGDLPCRLGDSVAINGCCLTVVEVDGLCWAFEAGAETLSKTNLGRMAEGDPVNLERPLPAGGRLGGHFVQGHVDGVGTVESVERDGEWVTMWFRVPAELGRQMVTKGSVTIDGVSLTLVDVEPERFSVALIPHTLDVTTLGVRQPGDAVNIETDILGKYVLKFMEAANGQ
jgi:riboflavin synthase